MKIGLMLTDSCNFQCRHCMVDSTLERRIADARVIARFYEIVRENKPDTVCLLGGEPLLFLDKVEEILANVREYCKEILIYSNGTFLLDEEKRRRVAALGAQVRISKTDYHKDFWNDELEAFIDESPYWKIEGLNRDINIFPRGRALSNGVYKNQQCPCSLVNQIYEGKWHSNRFLVMMDGSVNIWCSCMSPELANVFEDAHISHELLVERECALRDYLRQVNMLHDNMLFMCNEVCGRFRVSKKGIYRDGEQMVEWE
ncbi:MAG: radical SAM protein [Lachnospiraceae bacterium]